MLNRRRFLTISAAAIAATGTAASTACAAAPVHMWQGVALGAAASIRLSHPDAAAITARAAAEIARLEGVFSLYRPTSALSRLNAAGGIDAPPFELLECLSIAGSVHRATQGRFDPTVQRLWQAHAVAASEGRAVTDAERKAALALTGWDGVVIDDARITLRPGMALTLNGIAQGYIADRIAALLAAEGLTDILIDTGELRALGGHPHGGGWPVTLAQGGTLRLSGRALATSAPLGTVLDAEGKVGHILNPAAGEPAPALWSGVTVSAPTAALADALSTAGCLLPDRAALDAMAAEFPGAGIEAAQTA